MLFGSLQDRSSKAPHFHFKCLIAFEELGLGQVGDGFEPSSLAVAEVEHP